MIRQLLFLFAFLLIANLSSGQNKKKFQFPEGITNNDFVPNLVVVKFLNDTENPNQRTLGPAAKTDKIKKLLGAKSINQVFPALDLDLSSSISRKSKPEQDLSNIYKIYLNDGDDILEAINLLLLQPEVVYAEPYYNIRPLHVPNDPGAHNETGSQDHLKVIKAYEAWDLSQGDTSIVIGIIDTGYDPTHEDLKANVKNNFKDPINNFDDDDDGYKDNFAGWDFANNDNKPHADKNGHGTEVSGICASSGNNGIGIIGTGYKSKFMPIKIYKTEDDSFSFGYEAIVYAANKGCKVINLSWGDYRGGYSNFVQDIINFAALEKDVVIVAAAGNTNDLLNFYPASYQNVLSVGSTDYNDNKTSWGTYSYHIDLMAPGQEIYTTKNSSTYGRGSGSSFSAPMVAGAAALVRAKFPQLNALQVIEKLRVTTDDIYHIPFNQTFKDKLGKGRLNMHRALSDISTPAIRMSSFNFQNRFGRFAFAGDTVQITCKFINYLSPSSNATVSITSPSPYVTILNGTFSIGSLATLASKENNAQPFMISLRADTPSGTIIPLRMVFEDGTYNDFQVLDFETTPDFLTINNGNVGLTISGNGNLGYHNDYYNLGNGFTYKNNRIIDFMGMMIATDPEKVYNNVIHRFDNKKRNNDFTTLSTIKIFNNGAAHLEARSHFEDNSADLVKQNLKIDQKLLSFKDLPDNDFLILEYRILNNSTTDRTDVYSGIYADWNVNNKFKNVVQWDENLKLNYIYNPEKPDIYAGIAILTPQKAGAYVINNSSNNLGDITNDFIFSRTEKYTVLSSGTTNANSPTGSTGSDVSHVISAQITSISKNSAIKVAYAFVAGSSLDNLKKNVEAARQKYDEHNKIPPLISSTLICEGQSAVIDPAEGTNYKFYSDVNLKNLVHTGTSLTTGAIEEDSVFYLVNIDRGYDGDISQARITINKSINDFSISPETLIITEDGENTVQFEDYNTNSVKWSWNFGNGYGSSIKNPKVKFLASGTYNVKLIAENNSGCKNTIYKKLVVLKQSPDPNFSDLQICQGIIPEIQAENSLKIKVYATDNSPYPIYEGPVFEPANLTSDTTFYISNVEFDVDSPRKAYFVAVSPHKAQFELRPSNELENKNMFIVKNNSINSISRTWFVNDILVSNNEDLTIDIDKYQDFIITLVSKNPDDCEDQVSISYTKRVSDAPLIGKVTSCNSNPAIISPSNGNNFYFYEDENLSKLLHKGKSFSTNSHTKIFITGVDNFIESIPVEVVIDFQEFYPDFSFQPNILNLTYSQQVSFSDLSDGNLTWSWDFGNGNSQHIKNPVQNYDVPGEYWITLVAENQNGCKESVTKKLIVVNITDIDENIDTEPSLTVYPNPAQHTLFLNFSNHENNEVFIKVADKLNRLLIQKSLRYDGNPLELDVNHYPSGIYHLQVEIGDKIYYKKLVFVD